MEIEVETGDASIEEKKIVNFFSAKKSTPKKVKKKNNETKESAKIKITKPASKKSNKVALIVVPLLASICLALGFSTYHYHDKYVKLAKNPIVLEKSDKQLILDSVKNLVELPESEDPVVVMVSDLEKMIGQSFSADVSADDRVITYADAKKVIIYRPSSGKIVEAKEFLEFGNKNITQVENQTTDAIPAVQVANVDDQAMNQTGREKVLAEMSDASPLEDRRFRVAIYNGTSEKGFAEKLAQTISSANANIDIAQKTNAAGDYSKTIVVDLTGNNAQFVTDLASAIGGELSVQVPSGETVPEADVLVIAGGK